MAKHHVHETHPDIIKRLKRATGHLQTIITMIESHRSCLELAQQLHAVEKAIANAKKTLIHDHKFAHSHSVVDKVDETMESNAAGMRAFLVYDSLAVPSGAE
jgi:DNA-binding FrmR family transcriptional regulator